MRLYSIRNACTHVHTRIRRQGRIDGRRQCSTAVNELYERIVLPAMRENLPKRASQVSYTFLTSGQSTRFPSRLASPSFSSLSLPFSSRFFSYSFVEDRRCSPPITPEIEDYKSRGGEEEEEEEKKEKLAATRHREAYLHPPPLHIATYRRRNQTASLA